MITGRITSGPAMFEERAGTAESKGEWGVAASHWSKAATQAALRIRAEKFRDNAERCRRLAESQPIPSPFTQCVRIDAAEGYETPCPIGRAEEKIADKFEPCGRVLDDFRHGIKVRTPFASYQLR